MVIVYEIFMTATWAENVSQHPFSLVFGRKIKIWWGGWARRSVCNFLWEKIENLAQKIFREIILLYFQILKNISLATIHYSQRGYKIASWYGGVEPNALLHQR